MTQESTPIDAKDAAILNCVQLNGRITIAELAQRVALSETACRRRLERLEEIGIIAGWRAQIEPRRLGYKVQVFVSISLKSQADADLSAFEAAVQARPEILECWLMTGESDYVLRIAARDIDDLERLHREVLTKLPGVAKLVSSLGLRQVVARREIGL